MEARFVVKLILFLLAVEASADDEERRHYKCRQPAPQNCLNNTGIRVYKSRDVYQLKLCSDNQCAGVNEDSNDLILNCEDVCNACHILLGTTLAQISKTYYSVYTRLWIVKMNWLLHTYLFHRLYIWLSMRNEHGYISEQFLCDTYFNDSSLQRSSSFHPVHFSIPSNHCWAIWKTIHYWISIHHSEM